MHSKIVEPSGAEQGNTTDPAAKQHKHGATEHDAELFCSSPLYERIASVVAVCFAGRVFLTNRIYTNAMRFGDGNNCALDGGGEGTRYSCACSPRFQRGCAG